MYDDNKDLSNAREIERSITADPAGSGGHTAERDRKRGERQSARHSCLPTTVNWRALSSKASNGHFALMGGEQQGVSYMNILTILSLRGDISASTQRKATNENTFFMNSKPAFH